MFLYLNWSLSIQINFTLGSDGNPWVWVMGEHKDDLPYNELVRERMYMHYLA